MTFFKDWWLSMRAWRWLNLVPVAIALYLAMDYEAMPSEWIDQGERKLGETRVRLYTRGTVRAGEILPVRVSLSGRSAVKIGFTNQPLQQLQPDNERNADGEEFETQLMVPNAPYDNADLIIRQQDQLARWRIGRLIL